MSEKLLNRFKSQWSFQNNNRVDPKWEIATTEHGYWHSDFLRNGKLKKNAKVRSRRIGFVFTEELARHICDAHNFMIADDKQQFIKEQIEQEVKSRFVPHIKVIRMDTVYTEPKTSPPPEMPNLVIPAPISNQPISGVCPGCKRAFGSCRCRLQNTHDGGTLSGIDEMPNLIGHCGMCGAKRSECTCSTMFKENPLTYSPKGLRNEP